MLLIFFYTENIKLFAHFFLKLAYSRNKAENSSWDRGQTNVKLVTKHDICQKLADFT